MPRRALSARLWLQPARRDPRTGLITEQAVWCIRDAGGVKRSTGCLECDIAGAERKLAAYVQAKSVTPRERDRDPAQVRVAHVLAIYSTDVVVGHARPKEALSRIRTLGAFFAGRTLADVNGRLCRQYVAHRKGKPVARRELEDLRAAITYHWREGLCRVLTPVVMPEKGKPRDRWLTRKEAARLLWAAWRMSQSWKGQESDRRTGRHVARFILVGLYTGTRAGAICNASFVPDERHGLVDLDRGIFYRRAPSARPTKKRQPPCPLPDRLLAHLRRWKDKGVSHRHVVEWNGDPVGRVSKAFRSACTAAGLGEDVTPHTLRHTAATWMMQNGVEPWQAAGFLGMSEEILRNVYGHHHPEHLEGARRGVSARQKPDSFKRTKREQEGSISLYQAERKRDAS